MKQSTGSRKRRIHILGGCERARTSGLLAPASVGTIDFMIRPEIRFTADDYRTLPETGPRYQLIDGELAHMTPAPTDEHQLAVLTVASALWNYARTHPVGTVYVSPFDVYLSEHDVVQPDFLFVSKALGERVARDVVHGAPDLAVEVLSLSTLDLDLGAKKILYARHGVIEYWVIDLHDQTVSIYCLDEDVATPKLRLEGDATLTSDIVPGFALSLEELFGRH